MTRATIKHIKAKRNFADIHFHHILKLLDVLPIFFFFTTSEMMRNYTYKHGIHELPHGLRLEMYNSGT